VGRWHARIADAVHHVAMRTSAETPSGAPATPAQPLPAVETGGAAVPTGRAAVAGAIGAGLALGVSELLAGLLPGATSLVAAVGQAVIDRQPAGAKDVVVTLFGTNDKLALELVVSIAAVAVGALLGVIAVRRYAVAAIGFAAFGVVGFLAALAIPAAEPVMVAAQVAISVALGLQAMTWIVDAARPSAVAAAAGSTAPMTDPARRSFLLRGTVLGVGAVAAGLVGRTLIDRARVAPTGSTDLIPRADEVAPPLPAGADLAPATPGLTPIVMPNDRFYRIDTALLIPTVNIESWSLRVHGLVERETTLSFEQLVALPLFEQYVTIACVSNEIGGRLVGNAKWTGVRLRDVLDMAGVQPGATQLVGRSVDGWTAGMPTAWVMDPEREPMIAVRMNDEPLPPLHGYPARLIVPGLYGYVSATKWLAELELTTMEAFDGYWVPLGWAKEAPILTQSRIDTPSGDVPAATTSIAGIAWAPDRGISRVEVSVDGDWRDAELSTPISDATWVQWVTRWTATPGDHVISVRATDGTGALQEELRSPPAPDGARGWHTITVRVR
jgi:DMSO/TMAO reductase YedYZ molybdopterin-dependent catalytic subunit